MTTYFLELGWKSAVILVLATVVVSLLRKQSAGARHLVWKLACLSLLLVPMGQALMPGWNVLPEEWSVSALPLKTYRHFEAAPRSTAQPVVRQDVTPREMPAGGAPAMPFWDPISTPKGNQATAGKTVATETQPKFVEVIRQVPVASPSKSTTQIVLSWVAMIWMIGAGGLLCRLMVSTLRLWWVSSRLEEVRDEKLITLLESMKQTLWLRRSVGMRISSAETMPMVWGLWKPEIIVPETIVSWPVEQQTSVLLHELAHVKRRDPFWQVVVELTKVIYWPQPLLWLAMRQIERLREQACDDLVLNAGVVAADYARSLLDVVSHGRLRRIWPAVGVAIVSTPSIEMRLKTILDRTVNRLAVSRQLLTRILIVSCVAGVSLMIFRLVPNSGEASYAIVEHEDGTVSIRGQAVNPKGKPIVGAKISVYSSSIPDGLVAEVVTDKRGQFHFDHMTVSRFNESPNIHLVGIAKGYGFAVNRLVFDHTQKSYRLQFPLERIFEGQIVSADGTPIDQAKVELQSIKRGTENLTNIIRQLTLMAAFYSQADGTFRIRSLPGDCDVVMRVSHPGIWQKEITLDAISDESQINSDPLTIVLAGKKSTPTPHFKDGLFDLRLSGRAVDLDGQPISGATIFVTSVEAEKSLLAQTTTDDDGYYQFGKVALPMKGPDEIRGAFEIYGTHPQYAVAFEPRISLRADGNWLISDESKKPLVNHPTPQEFNVTLNFSSSRRLNGVVRDDNNQPVVNAVVELIRIGRHEEKEWASQDFEFSTFKTEWSPFTNLSRVETDSNGEFDFDGLPSNCHAMFKIKAEGYVTRQFSELTLDGPSTLDENHIYSKAVTLTLQKAIPITVEFTDEVTGNPITGLKAYCHSTWTSGSDRAVTDQDGRISLVAMRGENVISSFLTPDVPYLAARVPIDVSNDSNEIFKVSLVPAAVLKLRVVDVDTHRGVEGFSIWNKHGNGKSRYFEDRYDRIAGRPFSSHPSSDADGVITVHLPAGKQTLGFGLDRGPFLHGYRYDFIGTAGATFDFVPGRTEEFEVKVRKAQRKDGKAIGEEERKTSHNTEKAPTTTNSVLAFEQSENEK